LPGRIAAVAPPDLFRQPIGFLQPICFFSQSSFVNQGKQTFYYETPQGRGQTACSRFPESRLRQQGFNPDA
jgi:hypothetical protein